MTRKNHLPSSSHPHPARSIPSSVTAFLSRKSLPLTACHSSASNDQTKAPPPPAAPMNPSEASFSSPAQEITLSAKDFSSQKHHLSTPLCSLQLSQSLAKPSLKNISRKLSLPPPLSLSFSKKPNKSSSPKRKRHHPPSSWPALLSKTSLTSEKHLIPQPKHTPLITDFESSAYPPIAVAFSFVHQLH